MVKFGSFSDIGKVKCDEVWLIVRSLKSLKTFPQASVPVFHVPDLSPSWELFTAFQNKKKAGQWNKDTFENWYKPIFLKEMEERKAIVQLSRLRTESFRKDILCVCFCRDESMCHRSLVKSIIEYKPEHPKRFYCLVTGSRTFDNYNMMCNHLDYLLWNYRNQYVSIVSGHEKGTDTLAERYADERGYDKVIMPAEWNTYGNRAGFIRSEEMHKFISAYEKRGVVCFWDGQSHGTANNFELAKKYSNPLKIVRF